MILNAITSRDLLIDAYKFYSKGNAARADDALRLITDRNGMLDAVLGCLEQAKKEEEEHKQALYIQAACFGQKFHPGIAVDEFQKTCRYLRVMNICRSLNLEPTSDLDAITDQLIARRKFGLARWNAKWLKADNALDEKILNKWSEHMIDKRHMRDEQVAAKIIEILGQNPIVSYADIANKAIANNRIPLAIKLIENEGQSSKQIPLLLNLKQYDRVLAQALATCDSNLIFMAIFKLKETIPSEMQFLELLKKHKSAFKYYCNFLAVSDIQKLIMISYFEGSKEELTLYLLDEKLESALSVCKRIKHDFAAHQIEIRLRLNKFQQTLKQLEPPPKSKSNTWVGLSVSATIINLIALGQGGKARDCQKRFEISDKKYKVLEQIAFNTLPELSVPVINAT